MSGLLNFRLHANSFLEMKSEAPAKKLLRL